MLRILNNTDQVKEHLPVDTGLDFATIKPFLIRAFGASVLQLVTRPEYEAMVEASEDVQSQHYDLYKQLRYYVEAATVNLAYLLYIPHGQVSISDRGFTVPSGEHKKQAFKWQIEALKQSYIDSGYEALEEMLRLLDGNRDVFTSWAASDAAKNYKKLFISSTEDFEQFQSLNGSRLLFRSLAANLYQVELMRTRRLVPTTTYQALKDYSSTGDAAPELKTLLEELLPLVKGHLANRALEMGIVRRSVVLTDGGVLRVNIRTDEQGAEPAQNATLQILQDQYAAAAVEYESLISELLTQNEPEQETQAMYDNTLESKLFHL